MVVALILAAVYVILLGIVSRGRARRSPAESWLLVYITFWVALMGLHAIILHGQTAFPPSFPGQFLALLGFAVSVGFASLLTLAYLSAGGRVFLATGLLAGVWLVGIVAARLLAIPPLSSLQPWLSAVLAAEVTPAAEVGMLGWLVFAVLLSAFTWRAFLREPLPLYANRVLYWSVIVPFLLVGNAVSAWLRPPWNYIGYGVHLVGTVGATYGVIAHRVVNLRETVRWAISRAVLLFVTAALVFAAITAAIIFGLPPSARPERWAGPVGWALVTALLLQPITELVRWLLGKLVERKGADPAGAVQRYSELISRVLDLDRLAAAAIETINDLLGTRAGFLILATREGNQVILEPVGARPGAPASPGRLSTDSPIYAHFVHEKRPLLQYDIDYHRSLAAASEEERRYFGRLEMDIYAPIISEGELKGLLAVGPKSNDDPFRRSEIDLLAALANQTVAALENARLVTDLRELNQRISALNEDLSTTNERLERLDAVKTDFLTIASHELRTPLTQLQAYSELLAEMSEQHTLGDEDILEITRHLSTATRRMTDVITALTDVTEIDVESMDLDFAEISLAEVIKAAIDPYADAIQERRQTLIARGLRSLPLVHADYKRLVQVFTNLITNAIKYTPDGGEINVTGQVYQKDKEGHPVSVRILVEDHGIGIDKANQELIFEKFFRVDSVNLHSTGTTKFKGAGPGLGLSIAKSIVEGHGGRIWVESPGYDEETCPGSIFHVVLPVDPPAIAARKRLQAIQAAKEDTLVGPSASQNKLSQG